MRSDLFIALLSCRRSAVPSVGNEFNPVSIGVRYECNSLHASIVRLLDDLAAGGFDSINCAINVRNDDSEVSKTSRLSVTGVVSRKVGSRVLSTPVVRQFDEVVSLCKQEAQRSSSVARVRDLGTLGNVSVEVERELSFLKVCQQREVREETRSQQKSEPKEAKSEQQRSAVRFNAILK